MVHYCKFKLVPEQVITTAIFCAFVRDFIAPDVISQDIWRWSTSWNATIYFYYPWVNKFLASVIILWHIYAHMFCPTLVLMKLLEWQVYIIKELLVYTLHYADEGTICSCQSMVIMIDQLAPNIGCFWHPAFLNNAQKKECIEFLLKYILN